MAKTVFPPLSLHRVTAPPAPSPRLPNSSILPHSLAFFHPSSSRSSTSRFSLSQSMLALRSGPSWIDNPLATPEVSGEPRTWFLSPIAKLKAEYCWLTCCTGLAYDAARFCSIGPSRSPPAAGFPGVARLSFGGPRPLLGWGGPIWGNPLLICWGWGTPLLGDPGIESPRRGGPREGTGARRSGTCAVDIMKMRRG